MTMIADDYAAIRSHMFGDDSFLPKKKAEPAPKVEAEPVFVVPGWINWKPAPNHALIDRLKRAVIVGIDPAKPGSDQTVVWHPWRGRAGVVEYYRGYQGSTKGLGE